MAKIVGIDLGTSTSEISILKNGRPFLIPNTYDKNITPSVVYINEEGDVKVGDDAISYTILEPENTIIEVKRLMGSQLPIKLGNKQMKPEEISACILKYLKQCAEAYLGEAVDEAVITVPAYFTNDQRVATTKAGELAGFKVERIINEPTAAALAYGIYHMKDQKYILVYDFGGGTLDVSVLEMFEGVLEVKASSGNNQLGGKEFDEAIIEMLVKDFEKQNKIDIKKDKKAMVRLKEASEKAKIELSENKSTTVNLPFLTLKEDEPLGIKRNITRRQFEKLIDKLVKSTLEPINEALNDAGLKVSEIDTVLLVGGTTKIPLVKETLKRKFLKEPLYEVNPDEAVACGAAIQAAIKSGELSGEEDIIITDVCPYSLGIECVQEIGGIELPGLLDILIERNTTVPVSVKKNYYTFSDNQTEASIDVYQGDNMIAEENNNIGNIVISGIPKAIKGEEKIIVEFSYDINGILDVKAIIEKTKKEASIRIDTKEVPIEKEIDVEVEWINSRYAKKVRVLIKKAEKLINSKGTLESLKEELRTTLYELKYALATDNEAFVRRYEDELTGLLYGVGE